MKARVLTGLIGGIFAIAALVFFPVIAIRCILAFLCAVAMHELLSVGKCKNIAQKIVTIAFAAAVPFLDMVEGFKLIAAAVAVYMLLLGFIQVVSHNDVRIEQTMLLLGGTFAIIMPIGSLVYIFALPEHGRAYLFLTLIIAWFSDMGAFFAGKLFGKHKLCEVISPKKTIEGFIGGIIAAVLFSLLGAWIYQIAVLGETVHVVYWQVAVIALAVAPVSVLGDLFCSIIKRHYGIKDFGNILPGHGGVLDRFDSTIFVAPLMYLALLWFPLIH